MLTNVFTEGLFNAFNMCSNANINVLIVLTFGNKFHQCCLRTKQFPNMFSHYFFALLFVSDNLFGKAKVNTCKCFDLF